MTIDPRSILINTDSYKVSMWEQYPEGTEFIYSYIEARGGADHILWFGLQAFLMEFLTTPVTLADVEAADEFWTAHGMNFNRAGWEYIVNKHGGLLPVEIKQIPEGTLVPIGSVLATVVNTDPNVPWITTWIETALLRAAWYGTNVATTSYNIKQLLAKYLTASGDINGLGFKLHDFGSRGATCFEASSIGGAAHLINFLGTDNVVGIFHAKKYYNADISATGFSIPASEHSTITSWGQENEPSAYKNMVSKFGKGLYACVSDSYNIYEAVDMWGSLRDEIIAAGGTLVIRPDSGDPVTVLSKIVPQLDKLFGSTVNAAGYKTLNTVRVIWGDGITQSTVESILIKLVDFMGYSADNFAFGMGGALLQGHTRDTYKFAMKTSAAFINGRWVDVFKSPVDDQGKTSKRGLVTTKRTAQGKWVKTVIDHNTLMDTGARLIDVLRPIFVNGKMVEANMQSFEDIRARSTRL